MKTMLAALTLLIVGLLCAVVILGGIAQGNGECSWAIEDGPGACSDLGVARVLRLRGGTQP